MQIRNVIKTDMKVEQKSYLAEFTNSYEQEAVQDLIKEKNEKYWIGLEYSGTEWTWSSTGNNIDYYTNWGPGEPHEQLETSKAVLYGQ